MTTSRDELIRSDHKLITIEGVGTSYKDDGFGLLLKDAFIRLPGHVRPEFFGAKIRVVGVLCLTNSVVTDQQVQKIKKFAADNPMAQLSIPVAGTNILFMMEESKISLVE
jgi:hypothetical protein